MPTTDSGGDLGCSFIRLLVHFRRRDLVSFCTEHARLYRDAVVSGDYSSVTRHYYSVMSAVIDDYFSGNFHFVPPEYRGQSRSDSMHFLHRTIAEMIAHGDGKHTLDIGCGVGGVMIDVATVADGAGSITGVTLASNEAEIGNSRMPNNRCRIIVGDYRRMPVSDASFDAAYAIYALKYCIKLAPIMAEVYRVLKPSGLLLIYDLVTTSKYDATNRRHRQLVESLQYACGMPQLHTIDELIESAREHRMHLIDRIDLSERTGSPFYACFTDASPMLMRLFESTICNQLIRIAEAIGVLPKGFHRFNQLFLAGTVLSIVRAGRLGIISGSTILLFRKEDQNGAS